jgi:signal transduction histidine kinase
MLPEGGTVTIVTRAGPAGHAQLVVVHTGPEIGEPPERPFEPRFAQLGEEEFPGLRLVVAQREATRARGTIAVAVAPGEATTVTVTLPVAVATR